MNEEEKKAQSVSSESEIPNSSICGISIRGWIALLVMLTICGMSWCKIDIKEPLYTLGGLVIGFYFGSNPPKKS